MGYIKKLVSPCLGLMIIGLYTATTAKAAYTDVIKSKESGTAVSANFDFDNPKLSSPAFYLNGAGKSNVGQYTHQGVDELAPDGKTCTVPGGATGAGTEFTLAGDVGVFRLNATGDLFLFKSTSETACQPLIVMADSDLLPFVPAASEARSVAIKANDFLNTLGADTHLIQGLETPVAITAGLEYTGIRNIRDDATHDTSIIANLCAIHEATGAMVDELPIVDSDPNNIADTQAEYEQLAACGAMLAAEGPNEPNNFNFNYNGKTCSTHGSFLPCAQYMAAEYAMVKGDPRLAGMQVWDLTEPGAEPDNTGLQFLTVPSGQGTIEPAGTVFADVANLHNYVIGNGQKTIADNQAWNAESTAGGPWDGLVGEYCNTTWNRGHAATPLASCTMPKVTTETGWPSTSITQDQQGKLITNLYLSGAKLGWQDTFVYLLFDEPQAGNAGWGFFSQSDGTAHVQPKLLGIYTHNMTTILSDTSSNFTVGTVNYSVADEPSTVHDLLMEKSNGTYELIVWGDQAPPKSTNVVVNLGSSYPTVNVYDITSGTTPVQKLPNASSVPLTVEDHALILEF